MTTIPRAQHPLALLRNRKADVWLKRVRLTALQELWKLVLGRGKDIEGTQARIVRNMKPVFITMALSGMRDALNQVRHTKALIADGDLSDMGVVWPSCREWLVATSESLTSRLAKKVASVLQERNADGQELTISELADRLEEYVGNQAMMYARSCTIWAHNEGAVIGYREAGVAAKEWLATEGDDVTCEHCSALDGKIVGIDEDFPSEEFGDVDHAPLHPNCRCSVLPVIRTEEN